MTNSIVFHETSSSTRYLKNILTTRKSRVHTDGAVKLRLFVLLLLKLFIFLILTRFLFVSFLIFFKIFYSFL